jgi:hypothetical protein
MKIKGAVKGVQWREGGMNCGGRHIIKPIRERYP